MSGLARRKHGTHLCFDVQDIENSMDQGFAVEEQEILDPCAVTGI